MGGGGGWYSGVTVLRDTPTRTRPDSHVRYVCQFVLLLDVELPLYKQKNKKKTQKKKKKKREKWYKKTYTQIHTHARAQWNHRTAQLTIISTSQKMIPVDGIRILVSACIMGCKRVKSVCRERCILPINLTHTHTHTHTHTGGQERVEGGISVRRTLYIAESQVC